MDIPPVGAPVRIKTGRFAGIKAVVIGHSGGKVEVQRDGWMIGREYEPGEVDVIDG
jgi:hypothetical protein